jgi:hypothetical protein
LIPSSPSPAVSPWTDDEMRAFATTCERVGIASPIVLSVYNFESGLDPSAVNSASHAQGLAQFLPATLTGMGYTADPLAFHDLGVLEQLPWVEKLLRAQVAVLGEVPADAAKLLHLQLSPATAKQPVVFRRGENSPAAYAANAALDPSGKGYVDETDLAVVLARANKRGAFQGALAQLQRVTRSGGPSA